MRVMRNKRNNKGLRQQSKLVKEFLTLLLLEFYTLNKKKKRLTRLIA